MALRIDESQTHLKGFTDYYEAKIRPELRDQEDRRRRAVRQFWLVLLLTSPPMIWWAHEFIVQVIDRMDHWVGTPLVPTLMMKVIGFINGLIDPEAGMIPNYIEMIAFLAVVSGIVWVAMRSYESLQEDVKSFLVSKICRFFGLHYRSRPRGPSPGLFSACSLLPSYDRFDLEDGFRGTHDGVDLAMAEVNLEQDAGKDGYESIYRGILVSLDFHKPFKGRTVILRELGFFGNKIKQVFDVDGERVHLESPDFERQFAVYSEDQVEARYLLTPSFQERATALARLFGRGRLEMAFNDQSLLIAVRVRRDWFEAGGMLITEVDNGKRVQRMVEQIGIVFDIIDTLNLALETRV